MSEESVATFDLDLGLRRLDTATVHSALLRSGRPELIAPVTQYLSEIRRLLQAPTDSAGLRSVAAGRDFVQSEIAENCVEGQSRDIAAAVTTGEAAALPPLIPTNAQLIRSERSLPISRRVALLIGASALAALMIPVAVFFWGRRLRPRLQRAERLPCRYRTRLLIAGREYPCMVVDFSARGCKITVPERLPKVREVRIVLGDRALPARISWRSEFFAGIRVWSGVPKSLLDARHGSTAGRSTEAVVALPRA